MAAIPKKRERERERREEGATMCHNKLLPSKVAKLWRNIAFLKKKFYKMSHPDQNERHIIFVAESSDLV